MSKISVDKQVGVPTTTTRLVYLLAHANRQMTAQLQHAFGDERIPVEHWRILEVLSDERGRPMGELAELVLMNNPALTKNIDRMVSKGLVYRSSDPADSRRVLVYPTDHGLRLLTRLAARVDQHQRSITATMGVRKATQLRKLLSELIGSRARTTRSAR